MDILYCNGCKQDKQDAEFDVDRSKANRRNRSYRCKLCRARRMVRKRQDPEFLKQEREASRQWRVNNPERFRRGVRSATLKKKYGITADEFDSILESQGGVCAICGSSTTRITVPGRRSHYLHVDHCHKTGTIRGLLCQPCNTALGKFNDSHEIVLRAAEYLGGR